MDIPTHRFSIGDLECVAIQDLGRSKTMAQLFPHIPEVDREAAARALNYDPEVVPFYYTPLLVRVENQWLLVDVGREQGDDADSGHLLRALRAEGIAPEDIAIVIITHLHSDHFGGLTDAAGACNFPNAHYFMAKAEWDYWMSEQTLAQVGETRANLLRSKLTPIQDALTLLENETEIVPGVTTVSLYGHTPGHLGVQLESAGERMLDMVDAAHVLVQMAHPDWSTVLDRDQEKAAETRRVLFQQVAEENLLVLDFHFPFPGLGHIVAEGNAFKWLPVEV